MGRSFRGCYPADTSASVKFIETPLKGAFVIELEPVVDERGYFARSWCQREFGEHDLDTRFVQCNTSYNRRRGTLRGMHYQAPPYEEVKLVRCTAGAIFDVVVDLRPSSRTYCRWFGKQLSARNGLMMYVPKGFAHGFLTLEDDSEVFYQISEYYRPEAARGMRWDDPAFGIGWPVAPTAISERDAKYASFC